MSGHNKWSKIKNKKAVTDAQKSKIFGKLVRFVAVESKKAKGDVNAPGLRTAIEKAKAENVPSDNIERAIKKGAGGEGGETERELVNRAPLTKEQLKDVLEKIFKYSSTKGGFHVQHSNGSWIGISTELLKFARAIEVAHGIVLGDLSPLSLRAFLLVLIRTTQK